MPKPDDEDTPIPDDLRLVREDRLLRVGSDVAKLLDISGGTREDVRVQGEVIRQLAESSQTTATATLRLVDLQEERAKRERDAAASSDAASTARWRWLSDNWKVLVALLLVVFAPQLLPVALGAMGLRIAQPVYVTQAPAGAPEEAAGGPTTPEGG